MQLFHALLSDDASARAAPRFRFERLGLELQRVCAYAESFGLQAPSTTLSPSSLSIVGARPPLPPSAVGVRLLSAVLKSNVRHVQRGVTPTTSCQTPVSDKGRRGAASNTTWDLRVCRPLTVPPTTRHAPLLSHYWASHRARCVTASPTLMNSNRTAAI